MPCVCGGIGKDGRVHVEGVVEVQVEGHVEGVVEVHVEGAGRGGR